MIRYYWSCEQDHVLTDKSFEIVANLILGKNNQKNIEKFKKYFKERVNRVSVYPQGTINEHVNNSIPGICRLDDDEKIVIEMLGYSGASDDKFKWIKHECTHEFCHAFTDLLPELTSKNPNGIIEDGVLYKNHMGMVRITNSETGAPIAPYYYGKMFNETMMDIIASMAINCFDDEITTTSVDDVLQSNFREWGNVTTSFAIFTSITRLTIAAFSNNGIVNYQNCVDSGQSIFTSETRMKNGEIYKTNDFLYGFVFDQLHIEEEFDKFVGKGSYRNFCKVLDMLFLKSLGNKKLPSEHIKTIMKILSKFLNNKINYYLKNGIVDLDGANRIINKFNLIWNSMQTEYNAYFSKDDMDEISRKDNSW